MNYDFDTIIDRSGSLSEKYDRLERIFGRKDIIPLWVADMDFETPHFIMDAVRQRATHNVLGYSYRGDDYHNAIINWTKRRNNWEIERSWIEYTPGTVAAISIAIRAFTKEGDGIVVQTPVYPPFFWAIESNGRKIERNALSFDSETSRAEIDFDDLEERLARSKMMILCNPHNPSGRVFTAFELERIAGLCEKYDVVIVSDEVHCDLTQKPYQHTHISSLNKSVANRCITIISGAKTFNIAGLTTSAVIIPNTDLRKTFAAESFKIHIDQGNVFGTVALQAAFTHGDQWLDELNHYLGGNMDYVMVFLRERMPEVKCHRPEATYLMWLDFRAWGMTHEELTDFMVNKARLGFSQGKFFGCEGSGYMRMNIAAPRSVIRQAMQQLYDAAKSYGHIKN